MMPRRLAPWATAWLLLASQALAQPADEIILPARVLSEGYSPAVTVSGRALVGVMLDPEGHPNHQGSEQRLHVWLPGGLETQDRQLCITLSSRDGLYTGLLEAPLDTLPSPSAARPINVTFATQREDYYSRYQETPPPHRLAVLAEIKSACTPAETAAQILPVAWADIEAPGILNVMVNSSRMRTLFAVPVDRPGQEEGPPRHLAVECDDIDATQRIAFDTICRVDLARLNEAGTPRLGGAQLMRMRGPSPARPIPVPLAQ